MKNNVFYDYKQPARGVQLTSLVGRVKYIYHKLEILIVS